MATATLRRLEIGIVQDAPGFVLLKTSDELSEITSAGYINKVQQDSEVKVNPTDFVFTTYSPTDVAIFKPQFNNGVITLVSTGGGGGAGVPNLNNFQYVANTGDDANDGMSLGSPKATFNAALSALGNPPVTNPGIVVCLDTGPYDENVVQTADNILIYAPFAFISPSSGVGLTINVPGGQLVGGEIGAIFGGGGANAIDILAVDGGNFRLGISAGNINIAASGANLLWSIDSLGGDMVIDPSAICKGTITQINGSITPESNFFGRVDLDYYGSLLFRGSTRLSFASLAPIGDGTTLGALHQGRLLQANSGALITITCPEDATDPLGNGWQTECLRQGSGAVTFVTEGADTFVGGGTSRSITAQGNIARVVKIASGLWAFSI